MFTKHRERIQNIKEAAGLNYICKNESDKVCFAHDAAYTNSKDLTKKSVSDKTLKNGANKITLNPKHDWYQRGSANIMYNSFDKKIEFGVVMTSTARANVNEVLAQKLHKPVI